MSINAQATGRWEPSTEITFLPRCPGCHEPHPRALGLGQDDCATCGAHCPVGPTRTVAATITGFSVAAIVARFLFGIGRFLYSLVERLSR